MKSELRKTISIGCSACLSMLVVAGLLIYLFFEYPFFEPPILKHMPGRKNAHNIVYEGSGTGASNIEIWRTLRYAPDISDQITTQTLIKYFAQNNYRLEYYNEASKSLSFDATGNVPYAHSAIDVTLGAGEINVKMSTMGGPGTPLLLN